MPPPLGRTHTLSLLSKASPGLLPPVSFQSIPPPYFLPHGPSFFRAHRGKYHLSLHPSNSQMISTLLARLFSPKRRPPTGLHELCEVFFPGHDDPNCSSRAHIPAPPFVLTDTPPLPLKPRPPPLLKFAFGPNPSLLACLLPSLYRPAARRPRLPSTSPQTHSLYFFPRSPPTPIAHRARRELHMACMFLKPPPPRP